MASGALWVKKETNSRTIALKLKVAAGIGKNISMDDFVTILLEDTENRVNELIMIAKSFKDRQETSLLAYNSPGGA